MRRNNSDKVKISPGTTFRASTVQGLYSAL